MAAIAINYPAFVRRIELTGSITLLHEEIPAPIPDFRRELRRAGRAAGIQILTSSKDGSFIAWDPDFVVSPEALRAAMDSLASLDSSQPNCPMDGVVLRDTPNGWICPACGHEVDLSDVDVARPSAPIRGIHGG